MRAPGWWSPPHRIELRFPVHACTIPEVIKFTRGFCDVARQRARSETGPAFGESDKAMQRLKPLIGRGQRIGSRRGGYQENHLPSTAGTPHLREATLPMNFQ